jgi:hypothetical protein
MSFINKFKDTANVLANKTKEAGNSIGTATKSAVERQKLKSAISKEESNIEKQYTAIGKKYVELFGEQAPVEFADFLKSIDTSKAEIDKLNVQLNALDDCVVCACGKRVPKDSSFCPNCGNAIVAPVDTIAEEVKAEEVTTDTEPPVEAEPQATSVEVEDTTTPTNNDTLQF